MLSDAVSAVLVLICSLAQMLQAYTCLQENNLPEGYKSNLFVPATLGSSCWAPRTIPVYRAAIRLLKIEEVRGDLSTPEEQHTDAFRNTKSRNWAGESFWGYQDYFCHFSATCSEPLETVQSEDGKPLCLCRRRRSEPEGCLFWAESMERTA